MQDVGVRRARGLQRARPGGDLVLGRRRRRARRRRGRARPGGPRRRGAAAGRPAAGRGARSAARHVDGADVEPAVEARASPGRRRRRPSRDSTVASHPAAGSARARLRATCADPPRGKNSRPIRTRDIACDGITERPRGGRAAAPRCFRAGAPRRAYFFDLGLFLSFAFFSQLVILSLRSRVTTVSLPKPQIDPVGPSVPRVDPVVPGPALDDVPALAARDAVATGAAVQRVVAASADSRSLPELPNSASALDPPVTRSLPLPPRRLPRPESPRTRSLALLAVDGVHARATAQVVVAAEAVDAVVAALRVDGVRTLRAGDLLTEVAAGQGRAGGHRHQVGATTGLGPRRRGGAARGRRRADRARTGVAQDHHAVVTIRAGDQPLAVRPP